MIISITSLLPGLRSLVAVGAAIVVESRIIAGALVVVVCLTHVTPPSARKIGFG